jgi:hypothetical protein
MYGYPSEYSLHSVTCKQEFSNKIKYHIKTEYSTCNKGYIKHYNINVLIQLRILFYNCKIIQQYKK